MTDAGKRVVTYLAALHILSEADVLKTIGHDNDHVETFLFYSQ